jgi:hypothetical protein
MGDHCSTVPPPPLFYEQEDCPRGRKYCSQHSSAINSPQLQTESGAEPSYTQAISNSDGPCSIDEGGSCNQCAPTIVQRKTLFCLETYSYLHPNAGAACLSPCSSHLQWRHESNPDLLPANWRVHSSSRSQLLTGGTARAAKYLPPG